jgi:hypothetical protein
MDNLKAEVAKFWPPGADKPPMFVCSAKVLAGHKRFADSDYKLDEDYFKDTVLVQVALKRYNDTSEEIKKAKDYIAQLCK